MRHSFLLVGCSGSQSLTPAQQGEVEIIEYCTGSEYNTDKDHFRSNGKSKSYTKSLTFHPQFERALEWISKEKLHTKKHYTTLSSFLDEFKLIQNKIKSYIYEQ